MFTFAKTELRNLFSKPATEEYPFGPKTYSPRTRGHVENRIDSCIFCSLCAKKCPTGAITVDRAQKTWSIDRFGCIQCGYCVESCPKKCLSMRTTYSEPEPKKEASVFQQPTKEEKNVS